MRSDLEREVAGLIMDGKIQARIDSHNKVLHAKHADSRKQTYQQVMAAGEAYLRDTKVWGQGGGGEVQRLVGGEAYLRDTKVWGGGGGGARTGMGRSWRQGRRSQRHKGGGVGKGEDLQRHLGVWGEGEEGKGRSFLAL